MSPIDSVPLTSTTPTSASPSTSSYETTCAPPRSAPSSEYFEPEAQPPSTTPYTPSELTPIRYSRATGMSWMIRRQLDAADLERRTDRDDRERGQRRDQRDAGRERIQEAVGVARQHVFLEEQLERVGDGLEQTGWSDAIRADANLQARLMARRSNQVM